MVPAVAEAVDVIGQDANAQAATMVAMEVAWRWWWGRSGQ